jgi:hypothetical protein
MDQISRLKPARSSELPRGPVGPGDYLEKVPIGVLEVHAATAIVVVDVPGISEARTGPVSLLAGTDSIEDLVEFIFGDEKSKVLGGDLFLGLVEVLEIE